MGSPNKIDYYDLRFFHYVYQKLSTQRIQADDDTYTIYSQLCNSRISDKLIKSNNCSIISEMNKFIQYRFFLFNNNLIDMLNNSFKSFEDRIKIELSNNTIFESFVGNSQIKDLLAIDRYQDLSKFNNSIFLQDALNRISYQLEIISEDEIRACNFQYIYYVLICIHNQLYRDFRESTNKVLEIINYNNCLVKLCCLIVKTARFLVRSDRYFYDNEYTISSYHISNARETLENSDPILCNLQDITITNIFIAYPKLDTLSTIKHQQKERISQSSEEFLSILLHINKIITTDNGCDPSNEDGRPLSD